MTRFLPLLTIIVFCCFSGSAQTWTGAASTAWNNAGNWASPSTVPVAGSNVTIPGSVASNRWPVLSGDITINSLSTSPGCQLNVNGFVVNLASNNVYNYIYGGTIINSNGATDIVFNIITGINGYVTYLRGMTFADNVIFNLTGSNQFLEGDAGTANIYNGNTTFNISSGLSFVISYAVASQYNGNLSVSRTVAGPSQMFNAGGIVTGNFSYTNNTAGDTKFGNGSSKTAIGGTLNIAANYTSPNTFQLYRLVNQTTGGSVNVQNSLAFDVQVDTLKLNSFSITGYKGNNYAYLISNSITAATVTFSDDASYTNGYATYLRGNTITGNSTFSIKGTNNLNEADQADKPNTYNGNAIFNGQGSGAIQLSYAAVSVHNGNLTINRTAAGSTQAFNAGGNVKGNFSYTNFADGSSAFGNLGSRTLITGTLNILVRNANPNDFFMHRVINQTNGGSFLIDSTRGFNIQRDTLLLSSFSCLKYYGNAYAYLYNNAITATTTVADDVSYSGGYYLQVRSNVFTGNSNFTHKGTNQILEADAEGTSNIFNGNATFNCQGSGAIQLSYAAVSVHNGNLTISRTVDGHTQAFNAGGNVTGNFSYTNLIDGNSYFGNLSSRTLIGGTVNIQVKNKTPDDFQLYRVINQTTGGAISLDSTKAFNFRNDTLLLSSLTCQRYYGNNYAYLLNNKITATVLVASDDSYTGGYGSFLYSNLFTGNFTFTLKGNNNLNEAEGANTRNIFNGNVNFNLQGTGGLYSSHADKSQFNGNLAIARTVGGHTQMFNAGVNVTGNFLYTNTIGGTTYIGNLGNSSMINGTVNIAVKNASPADFRMYRVSNLTNGGTLTIDSTKAFDFQGDTLKLSAFNCLRYYGGAYAYFFNNSITANTTILDDVSYGGGYNLYIRNNVFTGVTSVTHVGANQVSEADAPNSANIYKGNTSFAIAGTAGMYISHGTASTFNGNLTVARTTYANTIQVFNAGGTVTGNFAFTNNIGGNTYLGSSGITTNITGQVNIDVNHVSNADMRLHRIKNQTAGGTVSLQNTRGVDCFGDTLTVNSFLINGYRTGNYAYFINNNIGGDFTLADDPSYTGGYATYIRANVITGNTSITNKGGNIIYDADAGTVGNKYMGNASFIRTGTGGLQIGEAMPSEIGKAFTMTAAGGVSIKNLRFSGNSNGSITQGGTFPITINNLFIDKATPAQSIVLNDSVLVATNAQLNTGMLIGTAGKGLVFLNNATCTNASNASHVLGPVAKVGNQAFVFPVGNGTAIQTAGISAPGTTSDRIRTEYFASSPHPAYDTSNHAPALKVVSGAQYWMIDRLVGNNNIFVTLEYGPPRGVALTANQADYRVARWTGSTWADLGNAATTGTTLDGTVQAATAVSSFSPFTVAATSLIQPLTNTPGALSPACANSPLSVSFQSSGAFNTGNVFTAQLSNASGSFANPINIGSLAAVPNGFNVANVINAYLPSSAIPTGSGYRVRVISSNPLHSGTVNASNIVINSVYVGLDTTVALSCTGSTINLTSLYNTSGLTATWNIGAPTGAPSGNYRLDVINGIGCKDTAYATIVLKVATWTGVVSNNWHTPGNWNTGQVPDEKTHVIVTGVTPNPCVVSTSNAQAASVQAKNGATVNTTNGKVLYISGTCTTLPPS